MAGHREGQGGARWWFSQGAQPWGGSVTARLARCACSALHPHARRSQPFAQESPRSAPLTRQLGRQCGAQAEAAALLGDVRLHASGGGEGQDLPAVNKVQARELDHLPLVVRNALREPGVEVVCGAARAGGMEVEAELGGWGKMGGWPAADVAACSACASSAELVPVGGAGRTPEVEGELGVSLSRGLHINVVDLEGDACRRQGAKLAQIECRPRAGGLGMGGRSPADAGARDGKDTEASTASQLDPNPCQISPLVLTHDLLVGLLADGVAVQVGGGDCDLRAWRGVYGGTRFMAAGEQRQLGGMHLSANNPGMPATTWQE